MRCAGGLALRVGRHSHKHAWLAILPVFAQRLRTLWCICCARDPNLTGLPSGASSCSATGPSPDGQTILNLLPRALPSASLLGKTSTSTTGSLRSQSLSHDHLRLKGRARTTRCFQSTEYAPGDTDWDSESPASDTSTYGDEIGCFGTRQLTPHHTLRSSGPG